MKIKKDDKVIVIAGKDKGKTGKVIQVLPREDRVLVEGMNVRKIHVKPRGKDKKGQTVEKSLPIHISNVALIDPKDNKATRVGYKVEGGKKVRVAKRSNTVLK